MYGYKRSRVEVDADTHECFRYFALLRGVPIGAAMRKVLALHAAAVETEFPPVRAHMLAWREAMSAQRADPTLAIEPHAFSAVNHVQPIVGAGVEALTDGEVSLDDIPF